MHVMVTIDHPWKQSFNHQIMQQVIAVLEQGGHTVDALDLHDEDFDPVMRVEELAVYTQGTVLDPKVRDYQQRIRQADHLVYIFPVWWEVMPALLKGFFDKVFLPGFAFNEADFTPRLTHVKTGTVITTMGAPEVIYTSVEPVLCKGVLEVCGVRATRWFNLTEVSLKPQDARDAWVAEILDYVRALD